MYVELKYFTNLSVYMKLIKKFEKPTVGLVLIGRRVTKLVGVKPLNATFKGVPVDLKARIDEEPSAIHLAALEGNLNVIDTLIKYGADVNEVDKKGIPIAIAPAAIMGEIKADNKTPPDIKNVFLKSENSNDNFGFSDDDESKVPDDNNFNLPVNNKSNFSEDNKSELSDDNIFDFSDIEENIGILNETTENINDKDLQIPVYGNTQNSVKEKNENCELKDKISFNSKSKNFEIPLISLPIDIVNLALRNPKEAKEEIMKIDPFLCTNFSHNYSKKNFFDRRKRRKTSISSLSDSENSFTSSDEIFNSFNNNVKRSKTKVYNVIYSSDDSEFENKENNKNFEKKVLNEDKFSDDDFDYLSNFDEKSEDQFNSDNSTLEDEIIESINLLDSIEEQLKILNHERRISNTENEFKYHTWIKGKDFFRIDGTCSVVKRQQDIDAFNNSDNRRSRLFLISIKAGCLGISLIGSNRCVIFDHSWNPSNDSQAVFRIYRYGQQRPVYIYRFVAYSTWEEKIYSKQVWKESLSYRVVDDQNPERNFTSKELDLFYDYDPDVERDYQIPKLPEDYVLANVLNKFGKKIVSYHEHDSLLENEKQNDLSEEEKILAWKEFESDNNLTIVHTNLHIRSMGPISEQAMLILADQSLFQLIKIFFNWFKPLSTAFTYEIRGLAWVASTSGASGGICEKYKSYTENVHGTQVQTKRSLNTGIITFVNYNSRVPPKVSELTLAHEIGHNFGSPHDYPTECRPGGVTGNYIMYSSATSGERLNNNKFSICSLRNISTVLNSVFKEEGKINCFQEDEGPFCGNKIVEENEECDCGYDTKECSETCCYPKDNPEDPVAKSCTRPKEECFLTSKNGARPEEMCEVACQRGNDASTCKRTSEIESMKKISGLKLRPGSPCNDFQGYCDIFQKCRAVDAEGPLAQLKNLLLNQKTLLSIKQWVTRHRSNQSRQNNNHRSNGNSSNANNSNNNAASNIPLQPTAPPLPTQYPSQAYQQTQLTVALPPESTITFTSTSNRAMNEPPPPYPGYGPNLNSYKTSVVNTQQPPPLPPPRPNSIANQNLININSSGAGSINSATSSTNSSNNLLPSRGYGEGRGHYNRKGQSNVPTKVKQTQPVSSTSSSKQSSKTNNVNKKNSKK
ncbi:hypothetical protein RND71_044109 [Anisodus tanguticus]|uniref:ADAM10 endopeptidase n=1 Tax=Anisodus tanguticus TaxID=243964 RepID=A0AAE1ULU6_9SOLA|nr:hypothetical protein RND71_044109 [Anisodus tanguticus]